MDIQDIQDRVIIQDIQDRVIISVCALLVVALQLTASRPYIKVGVSSA